MDAVMDLPSAWRRRATELREWADAEGAARALESCASALEEALRAAEDELLTLREASREGGYSTRRLRELIAEGSVPNAGRRGAPRIRRGDLPRKASPSRNSSGYDVRADAADLSARLLGETGRSR